MSRLVTESPNLDDPDGFYAALVAAHQGLSDDTSELLNARLVLILANHIGNADVLRQALALARGSLAAEAAQEQVSERDRPGQGGPPQAQHAREGAGPPETRFDRGGRP